ncbi:MAG: ABC transporter substrate-binding protein [Pseudomonadota bacterium]
MSNSKRLLSMLLFALSVVAIPLHARATDSADDGLHFYVDADFGMTGKTAAAIMLGLETALGEVDWRIAGRQVFLLPNDHRGSPKRSKQTMETFLHDPNALAVIGGKQSPPYLSYGAFINASEIPLLLPWSAAGPVTRLAEGSGNWIFRLSVDDSKAGPFLVSVAMRAGCDRIALLLLDTGWGRANKQSMLAAFEAHGKQPALLKMFDTELGPYAARSIARDIVESQADCTLLVSNPNSGVHLVTALYEAKPTLQVISHWGILGSQFARQVRHEMRQSLSLRVLQTCGLEAEIANSEELNGALESLRRSGHKVNRLSDIPSSAGFVHGYDLAKILIAASEQAARSEAWKGTSASRRAALKQALEHLEEPVRGILRLYRTPFRPFSREDTDAHEALGLSDLCLAGFREDGSLKAIRHKE